MGSVKVSMWVYVGSSRVLHGFHTGASRVSQPLFSLNILEQNVWREERQFLRRHNVAKGMRAADLAGADASH